jgi:hypothetical protein
MIGHNQRECGRLIFGRANDYPTTIRSFNQSIDRWNCKHHSIQAPAALIIGVANPPYFAVGIANSAPFSVLSGHRCMIDF